MGWGVQQDAQTRCTWLAGAFGVAWGQADGLTERGLFGAGSAPRRVRRTLDLLGAVGEHELHLPVLGEAVIWQGESKETVPICPTKQNVPKAAPASSGRGAGKGFPWATMPGFGVMLSGWVALPTSGVPRHPSNGSSLGAAGGAENWQEGGGQRGYLGTPRPGPPCRRRCPGRARHMCGTARGKSRRGSGCETSCGST